MPSPLPPSLLSQKNNLNKSKLVIQNQLEAIIAIHFLVSQYVRGK